jgi:hypothetical protein
MVNWVPSIHSGITPNLSHASSKGGRGSSSSVTMADIHMLKTATLHCRRVAAAIQRAHDVLPRISFRYRRHTYLFDGAIRPIQNPSRRILFLRCRACCLPASVSRHEWLMQRRLSLKWELIVFPWRKTAGSTLADVSGLDGVCRWMTRSWAYSRNVSLRML